MPRALPVTFNLTRRLQDINAAQWNRLAGDHPLVSHEFLLALDNTGCATPRSGWAPHFLLMHRDEQLAAAMPLYLKSHSRGEYVRSEERRVGKELVSTCRYRGSAYH